MVKKEVPRKKEYMKKLVEGVVMGLGFFVMFGIVIFPGLRGQMAAALNVVLGPLTTVVGNGLIVIIILAIITGIYTSIVQKYTMNWEVMGKSKELQMQLREIQKEYIEAKREENQHKLKRLEKRRGEVMKKQTELSGEMFRQQMKPMSFIVIITIPIFMWIWQYVSGTAIFPLIGPTELSAIFKFGMPYWVLWYMVCSILITQVVRKALGIKSAM
ncbi:MAG: EMC3/TMCO1 family protein [Halobacteriota archaeon]